MSRAIYTFTNKQDNQVVEIIEFDLLDNLGCRAWQYAVMLNNKSRLIRCADVENSTSTALADISQNYVNLKKIVNSLSQTKFSCEYNLPESFELVTQELMNRLHQHFTNSCSTLWNPKYSDFENLYELNGILNKLNEEIHTLENFIPTENKLIYNKIRTPEIWTINHGDELGYDILPFRHYHSYEPADLILDSYILGKTLLESFRCNDNPTCWDTCGHVRTNGGACMLLGNGRQELYNSDAFNKWLADYGITKEQSMADFPLGNFVSGHKNKLISLQSELYKYYCQVEIQL